MAEAAPANKQQFYAIRFFISLDFGDDVADENNWTLLGHQTLVTGKRFVLGNEIGDRATGLDGLRTQ